MHVRTQPGPLLRGANLVFAARVRGALRLVSQIPTPWANLSTAEMTATSGDNTLPEFNRRGDDDREPRGSGCSETSQVRRARARLPKEGAPASASRGFQRQTPEVQSTAKVMTTVRRLRSGAPCLLV